MAKFHINSKGEPGSCRAEAGRCPFGGEDAHYASKEEAMSAYEKSMAASTMPAASSPGLDSLSEKLEAMEFELMDEWANASPQNHELLNRVIDQRAVRAMEWGRRMEELSPYSNPDSPCDKPTYSSLNKEFNQFKDHTAAMVEAHCNSPYYSPAYSNLDVERVGAAVTVASHEVHSKGWYEARFNTMGGSDVATLVVMDFEDPEKIMYWDRRSLKTMEDSKLVFPTDETVAKSNWLSEGMKGGALYRGTVWEERSRDLFAKEHPELSVINTKNQYGSPTRPWQQVNFDGVLLNRATGREEGILELKTGNSAAKWEDGPPLGYRAQVLYYLNATKLDYAHVGVVINDGEFRTFRLNRDDPVAPTSRWKGGYDGSMEDYLTHRVGPWFEELKKRR